MTRYWISCRICTIEVETEDLTITWAAPIAKRFVGQHLSNLLAWAAKQGDLKVEIL